MNEQSVEQARQHLGELVRAANRGEVTVITYAGIPAAVIAPLAVIKLLEDMSRELGDPLSVEARLMVGGASEGGPHA